jgi:DNA replication ATP-dependent helicase Dna2
MLAVSTVVEKLLDGSSPGVVEAGEVLLSSLSQGQLSTSQFLADPLILVGPPYFASRYLAQITLRAIQGEYETSDDIVTGLQALEERHPPVIERSRGRRESASERIVIPESKVLALKYPARRDDGHWEASIDALVTSGPLRGREIQIRLDSNENSTATFLVPYLWIHCGFAAYNLIPLPDETYGACSDTFLVIEPLRQVNATTVARSLHCIKPQLDQIRRGKGDVTVATLKGTFVHALFDRLLEGETNTQALYDEVFPRYLVQMAAVADDFFDENAFRDDVLRHVAALSAFIEKNPHLLQHTQLELKRYSATIGIQGRIDAVFGRDNSLDILELKTGARIRPEDHAQLFIYRLLLSDQIRRWQRLDGRETEITARLLSSIDGSFAPLHIQTDFFRVLDARNKLLATHHALGQPVPHFKFRYEGFNSEICGSCPSWTRRRCVDTTALYGDKPDAAETPELEYFRRFTRLVERERWLADQDVADLLDDSRTEARRKSFRTLIEARIVTDAEPFTFEFAENTSDIEIGDGVLIHSGNISSTASFHGYVRHIETHRARIAIPLKNLALDAFAENSWIIDKAPGDVTAEASHSALYDFLSQPMDAKKRAILEGVGEPETPSPSRRIEWTDSGLNPSQIQAIDRAANCDVFHLIWGPPGTGKTKVIPEVISRVDGPILLGAFTNTAVDKMLGSLLDKDPSAKFFRIGRSADSPELASRLKDPSDYFSEDLALKHRGVHSLRKAMQSARIVAATAHRASTLPYLRLRPFEMVIVDEAGQLTEPLTLGLVLRGRRFVLIGDDRQLPPVVRSQGLALSMFERLKRHTSQLTLLDIQYRMHPDIMAISNKLFYGGRLRTGIDAKDRVPPNGRAVEMIRVVTMKDTEEVHNSSRRNVAEANAIRETVQTYIRSGIPANSIGVISPFRAQVVLLRQLLEHTGVAVDTVERFQGGERDVMILSFVRPHGNGFVFDERRFNVAITRARRKLVLVAHPNLFRNSQYEWISTFTETLKTAGTT